MLFIVNICFYDSNNYKAGMFFSRDACWSHAKLKRLYIIVCQYCTALIHGLKRDTFDRSLRITGHLIVVYKIEIPW